MSGRGILSLASPPAAALLAAMLASGCTPGRVDSGPDASAAGDAGTDGGPPCAPASGSLGEPCACDAACGAATPRCARDLDDDADGRDYCTVGCADGSCPAGYDCAADAPSPFCRRCASAEPGVVPLAELCLCDADCAPGPGGEATQCAGGVCRITSCTPGEAGSCPGGFGCEARPGGGAACDPCLEGLAAPSAQGEPCGCSADCDAELSCHRGSCAKRCEYDEQCGAGTCTYRVGSLPHCEPPILDCLADASAGPGQSCHCNADCGPDAPACLLGALGGVEVDRCTVSCAPGAAACPADTRCCVSEGSLSATCLPSDLADALSDWLRCDLP